MSQHLISTYSTIFCCFLPFSAIPTIKVAYWQLQAARTIKVLPLRFYFYTSSSYMQFSKLSLPQATFSPIISYNILLKRPSLAYYLLLELREFLLQTPKAAASTFSMTLKTTTRLE